MSKWKCLRATVCRKKEEKQGQFKRKSHQIIVLVAACTLKGNNNNPPPHTHRASPSGGPTEAVFTAYKFYREISLKGRSSTR